MISSCKLLSYTLRSLKTYPNKALSAAGYTTCVKITAFPSKYLRFDCLQGSIRKRLQNCIDIRQLSKNANSSTMERTLGALETMFPCSLGEDWDNVGLLIGTPDMVPTPEKLHVFLTNDLTLEVLDEAFAEGANLIVTYHPTPFRPLKKFTTDTVPGEIVLRCAAQGVAVYSPHTACDNAKGGVNDWLLAGLGICSAEAIVPISPLAVEGSGRGRVAVCTSGTTLHDVVCATKKHLGLTRLRVCPSAAARRSHPQMDIEKLVVETAASKVAVCAGSGVSVLTGCGADVWVTGEMSHHDLLAANAAGVSVILTEHSNSERGYLKHLATRLSDLVGDTVVECTVSAVDADPVSIV